MAIWKTVSSRGDGKQRIFAIGNYLNPRLLHPVHKWAMSILARIKCDGTFDQVAPCRRLVERVGLKISSFDLKSAVGFAPVYDLFIWIILFID